MDTADFDLKDFDPRHAEADKALLVRFFTQPLRNEEKSIQEGRPIFDDTEMVEIRVRGEKDNVVVREIRPDDKRRFRDAYKHFREGKTLAESGTPLSAWSVMSASQVEELRYLGFYTVEHVADAADSAVSKFPGMQSLKNRAKLFLEAAKGNAPLEKLSKSLEEKQNEIEALKAQMAAMAKTMEKLSEQVEKTKK